VTGRQAANCGLSGRLRAGQIAGWADWGLSYCWGIPQGRDSPENPVPVVAFYEIFRHANYRQHRAFWRLSAIKAGTVGVEIASNLQPQARLVPALR
jgi:hypothetical protein